MQRNSVSKALGHPTNVSAFQSDGNFMAYFFPHPPEHILVQLISENMLLTTKNKALTPYWAKKSYGS